MVKSSHELLRIFWPQNLTRSTTPGVVVGWRNSEFDLFVITVLEDVEIRSVESALRMGTLFRSSPHPVARIFQVCDRSNMHVLGTLNYSGLPPSFELGRISAFTSPKWKRPQIFCPTDAGLSIQVVMFDPPDPTRLQYMSLDPISLSLGNNIQSRFTRTPGQLDEIEEEEHQERIRKEQLVSKLRFHTVVRHQPSRLEVALSVVLRQINCVEEVANLLQRNTPLVGPRRKRTMSVSERVVESAQTVYTFAAWSFWILILTYAYPLLIYVFKLVILGHRFVAEGMLRILEWPLPIQGFV